jgi:hypothetical protein
VIRLLTRAAKPGFALSATALLLAGCSGAANPLDSSAARAEAAADRAELAAKRAENAAKLVATTTVVQEEEPEPAPQNEPEPMPEEQPAE